MYEQIYQTSRYLNQNTEDLEFPPPILHTPSLLFTLYSLLFSLFLFYILCAASYPSEGSCPVRALRADKTLRVDIFHFSFYIFHFSAALSGNIELTPKTFPYYKNPIHLRRRFLPWTAVLGFMSLFLLSQRDPFGCPCFSYSWSAKKKRFP